MIIGTANVNLNDLAEHTTTPEEFEDYCVSLVPKEFQHVKAICDNQKYYCCLLVWGIKALSWEKRKLIKGEVTKKLRVVGFTDSLIEAATLLGLVNMKRVEKFKEGE